MGDWFQRIIDRDVSLEEAESLAIKVRQYLIERAIISTELTDCALGIDGMGYAPGSNYAQVVEEPNLDLLKLQTNGLHIVVGRTVFDCGQGGFDLICPYCQTQNLNIRAWQAAVTEWYEARETGLLKCEGCDRHELVTEWHYEPTIAFGNLGFEFWNWQPLTADFIAEIASQLNHRIVYISGKL